MPPQYFEPLYVPPEETATLAEPVFDPIARGGLARVQPQAIQAIQPQAQIARQPVAPQRRTEMDYWGQPVVGGMPRDLFVALTGGAAQAIAPRTPMGRLGGGLARMAGDVYGRRMRREEEEPERALQRRISEARLRQLEKPEMVEYKEIDPETGREITRRVRPEEVPTERITGIPTRKAIKPIREKGIGQVGDKWFTGHYDETGRFIPRRELTKAEREKQVTGKEVTPKWTHADTQEYNYLTGRLENLDEQLQEIEATMPGDVDDPEIEAERRRINRERSELIDGLAAVERRVTGRTKKGGLARRGFGEPVTTPTDPKLEKYIQQAMEAGISQEDINRYLDDPYATLEGFRKKFRIDRTGLDEAPDMKNVPIKYPIPEYPYRSKPY